MGGEQSHIIARYGLELEFQDPSEARHVSASLLAASRVALGELLQQELDALVGPDEYVTLDKLELDLGQLERSDVEEDYLQKLQVGLREGLVRALQQQPEIAPADRALSVVAAYAATGQYPWWAGRPMPERLPQAVALLLQSTDDSVSLRLRALLTDTHALRRLLLGLPDAQVVALWQHCATRQPQYYAASIARELFAYILERRSHHGRNAWLQLAYQAIQYALQGDGAMPAPQAVCEMIDLAVGGSLPAAIRTRLAVKSELHSLVSLLVGPLEIAVDLVANFLSEVQGETSGLFGQLVAGQSAEWQLLAEIERKWHLGESRVRTLLLRLRRAVPATAEAPQSQGLLPQLRKHYARPQDSLAELLVRLAAEFAQAHPGADVPSIPDLESWLRQALRLPQAIASEAATIAAEAWETLSEKPVPAGEDPLHPAWLDAARRLAELPEASPARLLAWLAALHAASHADAELSLAQLRTWLAELFHLSGKALDQLVAALLPVCAAYRRSLGTGATAMPAWLGLLRMRLDRPQATAAELLGELAARYMAEAAAQGIALRAWLLSQLPLPVGILDDVLEALVPVVEALRENLVPEPSDNADWGADLRRSLQLPDASLPALLARLAALWPSTGGHIDAGVVMKWLSGRYPGMSEEAVKAVATALLPMLRIEAAQGDDLDPEMSRAADSENRELAALAARSVAALGLGAVADDRAAEAGFRSIWEVFRSIGQSAKPSEGDLAAWLAAEAGLRTSEAERLAAAIWAVHGQERRMRSERAKWAFLQAAMPQLRTWLQLDSDSPADVVEAIATAYVAEYPATEAASLAVDRWLARKVKLGKSQRAALAQRVMEAIAATARRPQESTNLPKPSAEKAATATGPTEWPYYLDNAGLVLVWPFLQRFFQMQGLVDGKQFVSVLALEQAVRILQHLVDPTEDWNEAALSLPKVLCGLTPDALCDPRVEVSAEILEAVEDLVGAALAHWTLAGELSLDGFRAAWMQRSGTLQVRDDHWILRVEAMGHDVILEGLPWDIAYIQLPWMRHVLYVDWGEKAKYNG